MELMTEYLLPCLWAFLACMGYCIIYEIHGFGMILCSLGGSLGWLTYLLVQTISGTNGMAAFAAGLVIAAYSETMARIRKCPASGYLLLAFFPPVPGAGVYYSVEYYLNGDAENFAITALNTLTVAGSLALGVLLVSSFMRMFHIYSTHRRTRHL